MLLGLGLDLALNETPLLKSCCQNSSLKILEFLRDSGIDILRASDKNSSLMIGCASSQPEVIVFLVENGADPNECNGLAIKEVMSKGSIEMVKKMIKFGANIEPHLDHGLRSAFKEDDLEALKFYHANGGNLHKIEHFYHSRNPLLSIVEYMINSGVDMSQGRVLETVISYRGADTLKLLIGKFSYGAQQKIEALSQAMFYENLQAMELIVQSDPSIVDLENEKIKSGLDSAAKSYKCAGNLHERMMEILNKS